MRKMKSRLVRVKVWYEPTVPAELVERVVQEALIKAWPIVKKDWVHSIEINDSTLKPKQPEPDF